MSETLEDADTSRQHIVMIPELLGMGGPGVGSDQRCSSELWSFAGACIQHEISTREQDIVPKLRKSPLLNATVPGNKSHYWNV